MVDKKTGLGRGLSALISERREGARNISSGGEKGVDGKNAPNDPNAPKISQRASEGNNIVDKPAETKLQGNRPNNTQGKEFSSLNSSEFNSRLVAGKDMQTGGELPSYKEISAGISVNEDSTEDFTANITTKNLPSSDSILSSMNIKDFEGDVLVNSAVLSVKFSKIRPSRFQARVEFDQEELRQLANSIRNNGIFQPILVRKITQAIVDGGGDFGGKAGAGYLYEIIAGERRFRAAKLAELQEIPVIIIDADDRKSMEIGLIENIQRQDLNPIEEAEGYKRLAEEFSYTQEKIGDVVGKSRSFITNYLRMLLLPEVAKEYLKQGKITAGHAKALLGLPDAVQQAEQAREIIKKSLNVRQAENLIKRLNSPKNTKLAPEKDPEIERLEENLSNKIGFNVKITNSGKRGRVIIEYNNFDELDEILAQFESV